jgi:hypothetical protein
MRQPAAQRLVGRSADDGNAVGRQERAKIGHVVIDWDLYGAFGRRGALPITLMITSRRSGRMCCR